MMNNGLNLGQCIAELEKWLKQLRSETEPEPRAFFEFCSLCPGGLHSYRGDYCDLAIGHDGDYESAKISRILASLRAAVGAEFHGWKGGEFTMDESSTLWVANAGACGETFIKGFRPYGQDDLLIQTANDYDDQ